MDTVISAEEAVRVYDINIDEFRSVTQADIDAYTDCSLAYCMFVYGLTALLEVTRAAKNGQGKFNLDIGDTIRNSCK